MKRFAMSLILTGAVCAPDAVGLRAAPVDDFREALIEEIQTIEKNGDYEDAIQPWSLNQRIEDRLGSAILDDVHLDELDEPNPDPVEITNEADPWYGLTVRRLQYTIHYTDSGAKTSAEKSELITFTYVPVWNYQYFFEESTAALAGPIWDVSGRAHCNGDFHVGSVDKSYYREPVTVAGNLYHGSAGQLSHYYGPVYFMVPSASRGGDTFVDMDDPPAPNDGDPWFDSRDESWTLGAWARWQGVLRDQAQGVTPLVFPVREGATFRDRMQRMLFWTESNGAGFRFEAAARVIITGDPGDPSSLTLYLADWSGGDLVVTPQSTDVRDRCVSTGAFYDGQYLTVVKTIDVDLEALIAEGLLDESNGLQENPLIYVSTTPTANLDQYVLADANKDPVWQRDGEGDIVFGPPRYYPVNVGPAGWRAAGINAYMPAVRVVNAEDLSGLSRSHLGLVTDRPLYVAGSVNTPELRPSLMLCGDSIIQTAYKQRLATIDSNSDSVPDSDAEGLIEHGYTRDMGNDYALAEYSWDRTNPAVGTKNTTVNAWLVAGTVKDTFDNGELVTELSGGGPIYGIQLREYWSSTFKHGGGLTSPFAAQVAPFKRRVNVSSSKQYYIPPVRDWNWDSSIAGVPAPEWMPEVIETVVGAYPPEPPPTPTPTATPSPSETATPSPSETPTPSVTETETPTLSPTPTETATETPSPTPSASPTPNGRAVGDFNNSQCTDLDDFLFLLDYWNQEVDGEVVDLDDFLNLLDNWQTGEACT